MPVQGLVDVVVGSRDLLFLHEPACSQLIQLFGCHKLRHFQYLRSFSADPAWARNAPT